MLQDPRFAPDLFAGIKSNSYARRPPHQKHRRVADDLLSRMRSDSSRGEPGGY
jgi:hypothetical protein